MAYSIEECRERGRNAGAWAASIFKTDCVGKSADVVSAWVNMNLDALEMVISDMRAAGTSEEALKWYHAEWMAEVEPLVQPEMDRVRIVELSAKTSGFDAEVARLPAALKNAEIAPDLLGWQQTRWGMSEDEVVNAVSVESLRRTPRQNYTRMYVELIIPNIAVGSYQFEVAFQMDAATNQLTQVLIKYVSEDTDREPIGAFKAAYTMLSERFGVPRREGTSDVWAWVFPTTTIDLRTYYIEGITSEVAVRYLPTSKASDTREPSAF